MDSAKKDRTKKDSVKYKFGKTRLNSVNAILDAAEVEFATHGYRGATMLRIAKSADIPRPNVHYYFENKQTLYSALLQRILHDWNEVFDHITVDDDPAESLQKYIYAKVMMSKNHPLASKIYSMEIIQGATHLEAYLSTQHRQWVAEKSKVIQSWIDQGKMDAVDPLKLLFMIWSSTEHYADFDCQVLSSLNKDQFPDDYFESVAEDLTHIILKGCGLTPPTNKPGIGGEQQKAGLL